MYWLYFYVISLKKKVTGLHFPLDFAVLFGDTRTKMWLTTFTCTRYMTFSIRKKLCRKPSNGPIMMKILKKNVMSFKLSAERYDMKRDITEQHYVTNDSSVSFSVTLKWQGIVLALKSYYNRVDHSGGSGEGNQIMVLLLQNII